MSGKSAEYDVISNYLDKIALAVKGDLVAISGRMVAKKLITADNSADLLNKMHGEADRANQLVRLLLLKVSPDDNDHELNFKVFVDEVLGADYRFYRATIEHLKTEYDKLKDTEQPVPPGKDLEKEGAVEQQRQEESPKSASTSSTNTGGVDSPDSPGITPSSPGTGDGLKPKYGEEKLAEIKKMKAPSCKLRQGDKHYEAVQKFAQEVALLIQTVNENETWAALEYMEGPKFGGNQQLPKTVNFGKTKVRLGMFSRYKAALIITEMGAKCEEKLYDALSELPDVKGVFALGIAWGCKSKCELADVLVATTIVGWNQEKWDNGRLIARDKFYVPMTDKFKEVFADLPGQWRNFERAVNVKSKAQKTLIVSTTKLINDEEMRSQVLAQDSEAKGGEMEGHVLVQKMQKNKPGLHLALIKGVSDFADGNKHDEWQLTSI